MAYNDCVNHFNHVIGQVIDNTAPRIIKLRIAYFDDHILINYWLFNVCFDCNEEYIERFISETHALTKNRQNDIRMDLKGSPEYKNWFTLGLALA